MTTSLPTTSTNEIFPGATPSATGAAALADGLAALLAPAGSAPAVGASAALPAEFSMLLDGGTPPVPTDVTPAATTSRPASAIVPTTSEAHAAVRANTPQPKVAQTATYVAATLPTDVRGLALKPSRSTAEMPSAESALVEGTDGAKSDAVLPDRATLEAIVALLAPVAMVIEAAPVAGAPVAGGEETAPQTLPLASGERPASMENSEPAFAPARGQVTVTRPGRPVVVLDENFAPTTTAVTANPLFSSGASETTPTRPGVSNPDQMSTPPQPTAVAARPALPTSANIPAPMPNASPAAAPLVVASATAVENSANRAGEQSALPAIEATAAVELSDGAVVTFALPGKSSVPAESSVSPETPTVVLSRPEKSAALPRAEIASESTAEKRVGKNFLTADKQEFKASAVEAGIGVAQKDPTMLFTPHDTLSTVHPAVPALVSAVAAAPQAAGAPAPEPMPQLVAVSVARRAVETVTNVVEAQAVSKLQPVPSVQLKFKIGHEDLAVRVALRDGVVHTEFRTDSPELRAALQQEWKAVTAQPESALRYLEPVVSAASSQNGTNSFAQQQQQSPGQSAAQQQQQQQQHQQARAAAEFFGSVARSTPFQPREGGAASTVAAAVLPTSVHLSAVA